jgi:hypothetical protein
MDGIGGRTSKVSVRHTTGGNWHMNLQVDSVASVQIFRARLTDMSIRGQNNLEF